MRDRFLLYFIICSSFISCAHCTTFNENDEVDTLFTTHSVTAVERGDTIEFLWRETSSEKCLPIYVHLDKKERERKIRSYSNMIRRTTPNNLNVFGYDFTLDKTETSHEATVYTKKYTTYVNQELIGSYSDKHKVHTLDLRDRKLFYSIMNYFESRFGIADIYSTGEQGRNVSRNLAHYVCWKNNTSQIAVYNKIMPTCTPTDEKRQELFIVISEL